MATHTTTTLPAHNVAQRGYTAADVTALMTAAKLAWDAAPANRRAVRFPWRGRRYYVSHTTFRLVVHSIDGLPVAERWD